MPNELRFHESIFLISRTGILVYVSRVSLVIILIDPLIAKFIVCLCLTLVIWHEFFSVCLLWPHCLLLQPTEAEVQSGAPPIMPDVDAYLILYSVADTKSFQSAENKLNTMSKDTKRETAVILVANKSDIVRNRTVTPDGNNFFLDLYKFTQVNWWQAFLWEKEKSH